MTNIMEQRRSVLAGAIGDEATDPAVPALAAAARAHGVHLLADRWR